LTKAKGEEREKTAAAIRQFLCKAGPSLQSFAIRGGQPPNRDTPSSLSQASSSSEQGKGTLKRGGITDSSRGTLKTKKGAKSNADAAAPQLRFGPALGAALECLVGSTEAPSACAGLQRLELQGNEAGEETASVLASIVETHPALVELGCDDNAISLAVYGKLLDCATCPKSGGCGLTRLSVPVMDARRSKDKDEAKRVVERVERFNRGERETAAAAAVAEKSDKKSSKAKKNEGEEVAPTKGKHEKTTTKKSKAKQGDEDDDTAATKTEKEEDKKAEDVGAKLVGSASKTATKKKKAKGAKKAEKEKEKEKDDDKEEADEEKTTKSEETAAKSEAKLQSEESTAKPSEGDQAAKSADTKEAKLKTKTKTKKTSKAKETAPADDAPSSPMCDNGDGEEADDAQEEKKAKKGGKKSKKSKASKQTNKESN
jgi:hypothetical protein